jgi:hypothetical protein
MYREEWLIGKGFIGEKRVECVLQTGYLPPSPGFPPFSSLSIEASWAREDIFGHMG